MGTFLSEGIKALETGNIWGSSDITITSTTPSSNLWGNIWDVSSTLLKKGIELGANVLSAKFTPQSSYTSPVITLPVKTAQAEVRYNSSQPATNSQVSDFINSILKPVIQPAIQSGIQSGIQSSAPPQWIYIAGIGLVALVIIVIISRR